MPIQGFKRMRYHQVGKQTSFGSNAAAARRLPYSGPIEVDPNRETPDIDTGSLDPTMGAYLGAMDIKTTWEGKAAFNDLPYLYGAAVKGGVSPTGGSAKTWTFTASSLTADDFDYLTDQWGDDTTDRFTAGGGVVDSFTLGFKDDLGAFDLSADLIFARVALGEGHTGGLTIDAEPNWMYGAHTQVLMDTTAGSIGITPLADAIHGVEVKWNSNLDQKRFANGSNSGFALAGYGRGSREIELTLRLAKTTATIAEAQTIDDTPVPTRYFDVKTTSTEMISGTATPFSNSIRMAAELVSRKDDEIGNNAIIELTYRAKYDATLAYAWKSVVVCETASL